MIELVAAEIAAVGACDGIDDSFNISTIEMIGDGCKSLIMFGYTGNSSSHNSEMRELVVDVFVYCFVYHIV